MINTTIIRARDDSTMVAIRPHRPMASTRMALQEAHRFMQELTGIRCGAYCTTDACANPGASSRPEFNGPSKDRKATA